MSVPLDVADLIRTRLVTTPAAGELATVIDLAAIAESVIVDRQKAILGEVSKALAKVGGTAVLILWQDYRIVDENAARPRLEHSYNITVWSKPVLAGDALAADDVMQSIIARLWHWNPSGGHAFGEAKLRQGGLVPHKSYLIYDLEVVIPISH